MNLLKLILPFCALFLAIPVHAESSDDDFSMMQELSEHDWHDLKNERWNLYGQATYISSYKDRFQAAYTNLNGTPNSLVPQPEHSFTATFTLYLGLNPWKGGEFYFVPEMISLRPLSELKGLGAAVQNFELQKSGTPEPVWYLPRGFLRQTFSLGGDAVENTSGQMQLGGMTTNRRFVATAGVLSILDIFDRNSYAADLRQQFFNMNFMTHGAFDFAADARGYAAGVAGELYWDDWALRFGRFTTPINPNGMRLDYGTKYYGDQFELEHKHTLFQRQGAVKILGFRNHEQMGAWSDAITAYQLDPNKNATTCASFNYESGNATAPDLCWARKANNKLGIGINLEQQLADDIGVFFRGMYADGKTEVYSYMSSDRSISVGGIMKGTRWGRTKDNVGIGLGTSWISNKHAQYLNMGGIDGFIGDGKLNQKAEITTEIYYKLHLYTSTWLTADYQHIENPAYNGDRGGVDIYGIRAHFEF